MAEAFALAMKLGVAALPLIVSEWGLLVGAIAFFAIMPLGHLTLGVALLLFGAFVPRLPGDDVKHVINVGSSKNKRRPVAGSKFLAISSTIGIMAAYLSGAFARSGFAIVQPLHAHLGKMVMWSA
jgi:hypothetical protein